jgi:hypothetical protein
VKDKDRKALSDQLDGLKSIYPSIQSDGKGLFRKWVGFGDHHPELQFPSDFDWGSLTETDVHEMPFIKNDPLSPLASARLFNREGAGGTFPVPRSEDELRQARFLPEGYLKLKKLCLDKNNELLQQCGRSIGNSVVQKRSFCYRQICTANDWSGLNPLKAAERDITARRKKERFRGRARKYPEFPSNWSDPTIEEHSQVELRQTYAEIESNEKLFKSENRPRRVSNKGSKHRSRPVPKCGSFGENTKKRAKGRRRDSGLMITTYPGPDELCYAQIKNIIDESVARSNKPPFLFLALGLATQTNPAKFLSPNIEAPENINGVWVTRRQTRRLHRDLPEHQEIYLNSPPGVPVFWPQSLFALYVEAKKADIFNFASDCVDEALRSICPMATWPKLCKTLVRHGTEWFGPPLAWLRATVYPTQKHMAPSHYNRIELSLRQIEPFLQLFDSNFKLPTELESFVFGSKRVLPVDLVRDWAASWSNQLHDSLPDNFEEALKVWNVLAGGMYDVRRIFEGSRAGAIPAPSLLQMDSKVPVSLFKQKQLIVTYSPAGVRQFWPLLCERRNELRSRADAAGIRIPVTLQSESLYCHFRLVHREGEEVLISETPTHKTTAFSYADHPDFRKFAIWWPGWPRHFSNTYLREAGWHELEVQRFHRHAPATLDPLSWNQGYFPLDLKLYDKASKYFHRLLFC